MDEPAELCEPPEDAPEVSEVVEPTPRLPMLVGASQRSRTQLQTPTLYKASSAQLCALTPT
eukprot:4538226-Alexandrium_andersonii.AAC.1